MRRTMYKFTMKKKQEPFFAVIDKGLNFKDNLSSKFG